jgi:hypothetical protein
MKMTSASSALFLDLYLEFDDSGQISTKIYDKRDDFNFKIINFPNMCSNIPASPAYGVYISQLIRYDVINIPVCEIKGSSLMNLLIFYKLLKKLRLI